MLNTLYDCENFRFIDRNDAITLTENLSYAMIGKSDEMSAWIEPKSLQTLLKKTKLEFSDELVFENYPGIDLKKTYKKFQKAAKIIKKSEIMSRSEDLTGIVSTLDNVLDAAVSASDVTNFDANILELENRLNNLEVDCDIDISGDAKYHEVIAALKAVMFDAKNRPFRAAKLGAYNNAKKTITLYLRAIVSSPAITNINVDNLLVSTYARQLFLADLAGKCKKGGAGWKTNKPAKAVQECLAENFEYNFCEKVQFDKSIAPYMCDMWEIHNWKFFPASAVKMIKDASKELDNGKNLLDMLMNDCCKSWDIAYDDLVACSRIGALLK